MQVAVTLSAHKQQLDMETIARHHYDAVFRFCVRRIGADRAPDAAQDTFLTAQKCLSKFRGESSLRTWLFGIAINECRKIQRRFSLECCELEIDLPTRYDSEHLIVTRETLRDALDALTDEHRDAVLLHEVEGLTYDEAAEILKIPVGTVKSRLHHAFIQLRRALTPQEVPS